MSLRILALAIAALMCGNNLAKASMQLTLFAPDNAIRLVVDGGAEDLDPLQGSILTSNLSVGAFTFSRVAAQASLIGLMTTVDYSVAAITGTADGKAGMLVSVNNLPALGMVNRVRSAGSVSYLAAASGSSADAQQTAYVDGANTLSSVIYFAGSVFPIPGGSLVNSAVGSIGTAAGDSSSWSYQATGALAGGGGGSVAVNLQVLVDLVSTGGGTHSLQLSGRAIHRGHAIPEPTSLGVWLLVGLGPWWGARRARSRFSARIA